MIVRRGLGLLVRIAVLVGLVVVLILGFVTGERIYRDYAHIKERINRIEALASAGKAGGMGSETFKTLKQEAVGGRQDFAALKSDIAWFMPIASRLHWLPGLGPTFQALPHVIAMGDDFLDAAQVMLDGLNPLLDTVLGTSASAPGQASITERVLPALISAQPRLIDAQDLLEKAAAEREQFASLPLPHQLTGPLERLDKYIPALLSASQLAVNAPMLMGSVRPMTYVVLAQNNDELRPTGGFISAIGLLTLDQGKITQMEFKDGYAVDNWQRDHPPAPDALDRYMDAQLWVFRDSNFWPDFPTSAKAAEYFSQLDLDLKPDGVIAVDQYTLQILVEGLGSVVIPEDNNAVLTGDNTIAKVRAYWKPHAGLSGPIGDLEGWTPERKQYLATVFDAIRAKLETDAGSINLAAFGKAVLRALDERHILLYMSGPLGGGLTDNANWGAAIPPTNGDYFFAVDTNMGFNKANGIMRKNIDYSVSIDRSGSARAQATISYRNPSTRNVDCIQEGYYEATYDLMMNRCYWNYLRVYVPEGATLIDDGNGADVQFANEEAGKTVWARWLVIPTKTKQDVVFSYDLPQPVLQQAGNNWEYRLLIQKQAGTDTTPLHVKVTLPPGTKVLSASPAPKSISGNVVEFDSTLQTDQEIRILIH